MAQVRPLNKLMANEHTCNPLYEVVVKGGVVVFLLQELEECWLRTTLWIQEYLD